MKEEGGCHVLLTVLLLAVSWKQSWAGCSCMRLAWHHQESSGHCQLCRESTIFLHPFCWKIPYALPPFHCLFPHYFGLISFSFPVTTETICPLTHLILPQFYFMFLCLGCCVFCINLTHSFSLMCASMHVWQIFKPTSEYTHTSACVCVRVCMFAFTCMPVWSTCVCGRLCYVSTGISKQEVITVAAARQLAVVLCSLTLFSHIH